jgi:hypothetical protein
MQPSVVVVVVLVVVVVVLVVVVEPVTQFSQHTRPQQLLTQVKPEGQLLPMPHAEWALQGLSPAPQKQAEASAFTQLSQPPPQPISWLQAVAISHWVGGAVVVVVEVDVVELVVVDDVVVVDVVVVVVPRTHWLSTHELPGSHEPQLSGRPQLSVVSPHCLLSAAQSCWVQQ